MKSVKVLTMLKRAAEYASLKTAEFGNIHRSIEDGPTAPVKFADGRLVTETNVTEFIRERVHYHHETWVIGYIEEAMTEIRSTLPHEFKGPNYLCKACGRARLYRMHK